MPNKGGESEVERGVSESEDEGSEYMVVRCCMVESRATEATRYDKEITKIYNYYDKTIYT